MDRRRACMMHVMTKASVIVLRPTRGLSFTESDQSIDDALQLAAADGLIHHDQRRILRTWTQGIPDAFNYLAGAFIRNEGATHAWIVEEDVVVPGLALHVLLELQADVAAINYYLKVGGPGRLSELRDPRFGLYSLSTGCLLIRRRVFDELPAPWFRTDLCAGLNHAGSSSEGPRPAIVPNTADYGGHDSYFTLRAIQAGYTVRSARGLLCEHLELERLGRAAANFGCHAIRRVS